MNLVSYSAAHHGEAVAGWWKAHTGRVFQSAMLPPVGLVMEDAAGPAAACWLHLSAGVGVAFLENPVSRPGLSLRQARELFTELLRALEAVALEHDYGVLVCHTPPAIARILSIQGFQFQEKAVLTGLKLLR